MPKSRIMTPYLATDIAEGFEEATSNDEVREAWQYLVNTGMAWRLQGWFGRTAMQLIEAGEIYDPRIAGNRRDTDKVEGCNECQ